MLIVRLLSAPPRSTTKAQHTLNNIAQHFPRKRALFVLVNVFFYSLRFALWRHYSKTTLEYGLSAGS